MQIDRIILKDVGPFKDVTIPLPAGTDPRLADVYLLTGPNGSGKSTVLYALAALIAGGSGVLAKDLLSRRFRTANAIAGFAAGDVRRVATPDRPENTIPDPFGDADLENLNGVHGARDNFVEELRSLIAAGAELLDNRGFTTYGNDRDTNYAKLAAYYGLQPARQFSWAAFAYSGKRTLERGSVKEIKEVTQSPFSDSLSFADVARTTELASWIVSQQFKRLKAQEVGRTDRAAQFGQSIRETERLIRQIIGDPEFRFITTDEDNDVRVRWNGEIMDLDLLPDGLKSITSWIADLLMRLDRIPWVHELPVLQRSFLLLLDEVDLHLHPAWQRRVLPFVQQMFPNAQIIATTHSPFVVASAADAHIVTFAMKDGVSTIESVVPSQIGVSYSAVLRSIFGIDSEFDVSTEDDFRKFHEAKARLLSGQPEARADVERVAAELASRSEEVRELVALELAQLKRQLARPPQ